jgi:hypothetical protein
MTHITASPFSSLAQFLGESRDALGERIAVDELERQRQWRSFLQPMDRCDVGVIQRGENARFPFEAHQSIGVRS